MVSFRHKGDFAKTRKMMQATLGRNYMKILERYAQQGVEALSKATPIKTGKTAASWDYKIIQNKGSLSVVWINHNINKGVNIALILQLGHGTKNGGYVVGIDYINPALRPVFEQLANAAWKEVTSS